MKDNVNINGNEYKIIPVSETTGVCLGEAKTGKPRKNKPIKGVMDDIKYEETGSFRRFFWKTSGAVMSQEGDEYVLVVKKRKMAIFGLLLLVLFILTLIIWLATGQNPAKNATDYIGDRTGIIKPNKDAKAKIDEYTSFESVPDSVSWTKGKKIQKIRLSNLKGNTVELAPMIYVDKNNDGKFSASECVYNKDNKKRIRPGASVGKITLDKTVSAGKYKAQVVYKAYVRLADGTESNANGMNFSFNLNVK